MSKNPVNLALIFALELGALAAFAYWGWMEHSGIGLLRAADATIMTALIGGRGVLVV